MILISLFLVFLFIGAYNFGGGYAMIPLIISLVVDKYGWIEMSDFINFVTISQVTPGPIAINLATFVGYTVGNGVIGSIIATLASSCVSVIDSDFYTIYSFIVFGIIFYLTTFKNLHPIIAIFVTGFIGMWII